MRVILLSFISLFLTQCSVADPTTSWLEKAEGSWKLTEVGSGWLNNIVDSATNEDDTVTIDSTTISIGSNKLTFVGIDSSGVFAIYSYTSNTTKTTYIALGFNSDYDILFDATVYTSSDISTTVSTGNIFLTK